MLAVRRITLIAVACASLGWTQAADASSARVTQSFGQAVMLAGGSCATVKVDGGGSTYKCTDADPGFEGALPIAGLTPGAFLVESFTDAETSSVVARLKLPSGAVSDLVGAGSGGGKWWFILPDPVPASAAVLVTAYGGSAEGGDRWEQTFGVRTGVTAQGRPVLINDNTKSASGLDDIDTPGSSSSGTGRPTFALKSAKVSGSHVSGFVTSSDNQARYEAYVTVGGHRVSSTSVGITGSSHTVSVRLKRSKKKAAKRSGKLVVKFRARTGKNYRVTRSLR